MGNTNSSLEILELLGKIHPHGNSATGIPFVNAGSWSVGMPFVDGPLFDSEAGPTAGRGQATCP